MTDEPTPRGIIMARNRGYITTDEMLSALSDYQYTHGYYRGRRYIVGSWDEVERAERDGWISREELYEVQDAIMAFA